MWAIHDKRKIRHHWGGSNGSNPISLYRIERTFPLDYVRGAKFKKCSKCQAELGGDFKKEISHDGESLAGPL